MTRIESSRTRGRIRLHASRVLPRFGWRLTTLPLQKVCCAAAALACSGRAPTRAAFAEATASQGATCAPRSLNSIEGFLENFEVAGVANLFARLLDPFFLERILGRTIGLVEHAEYAGKGERGQFVGSEFVGDVVAEFVLGCVVPFFLLNHFEAAALFWIGRVEHVREKIRRIQTNIR